MPSYAQIIKKKQSDWKCDNLMTGVHTHLDDKIPFSSPLMNFSTYGGIPRRRISEFFGDPGSGKSTTAVDICKNAYKVFCKDHEELIKSLRAKIANGNKSAVTELEVAEENGPRKILYVDIEHGFDGAWAAKLGINPDEIDVMQPPDVVAEEVLQMIMEVIETGEVGLIVLDSIAALVPRAELEKKLGERTVAALAGLLTIFCRKVMPMLTRYDVTMIFINQVRENMDNPYVVKTPGGTAPKFYASLRILFKLGQPVDFLGNELPQNTENPSGYIVNAKLVKQKSAPFDRKNGSYFLMCQDGIRPLYDFAKLAITKYNLILKSGAWFTVIDPETGEILEDDMKRPVKLNGLAKVYQYLESNEAYYNKLTEFILNDINGTDEKDLEGHNDDE